MFLKGGHYFFTVNLQDRQSQLLTQHIEILRDVTRKVKQNYPFDIEAIVILPEHLHAMWHLPEGDQNYPMRWMLIKSGFSRQVPINEVISTSRLKKRERGIWQRRYWEHTISNERDWLQHIEYIHNNPVKHGYVNHPEEWLYSSYHRYKKMGIL
jgi:putative transposase